MCQDDMMLAAKSFTSKTKRCCAMCNVVQAAQSSLLKRYLKTSARALAAVTGK
jgi:hypothetical protein